MRQNIAAEMKVQSDGIPQGPEAVGEDVVERTIVDDIDLIAYPQQRRDLDFVPDANAMKAGPQTAGKDLAEERLLSRPGIRIWRLVSFRVEDSFRA